MKGKAKGESKVKGKGKVYRLALDPLTSYRRRGGAHLFFTGLETANVTDGPTTSAVTA